MELVHSSSLNGASFLLFELKQLVPLKLKGLSSKEIRDTARNENLFQFTKTLRTDRVLPSVMRRLSVIDNELARIMLDGSVDEQRAINLYVIMKTDLLFYEFMNEVIREKFEINDYIFDIKELNLFFTTKAEQSTVVASWSEINIVRLKSAYKTVLTDSGIIRDYKSMELNRLLISEQLKSHLRQQGDSHYIAAMGG